MFGHHNVLCLPLWQGVFLFTLQRYGLFRGRPNFGYRIDAKFNTNSANFQHGLLECVKLPLSQNGLWNLWNLWNLWKRKPLILSK